MTTTEVAGTVAVGYDGRPQSDVALAWAVRYASRSGRPVTVVHACGLPAGYAGTADGAALTANRADLELAGRRVLDAGRARARELDPDVEVRAHLDVEEPREVLADVAASGAHLLVVGTRGHGRLVSYLLGSVSEGASASATCPVVVAREPEVPDRHSLYFGKVVVGVDAADTSEGALREAFELAALEGRSLMVLHARDGRGRWHDLPPGFAEKYPDVPVSVHEIEADPRWVLVDASRHAHLIAVGSRGLGDTAALVRGSVSRYVIEHAHGPVLVVRPGPR
jgi:nucleotide-binding universal stress UspA family protein